MVQIRVSPDHVLPDVEMTFKKFGSGGIRTHAPEETGALNQRLRPLGHATLIRSTIVECVEDLIVSLKLDPTTMEMSIYTFYFIEIVPYTSKLVVLLQ